MTGSKTQTKVKVSPSQLSDYRKCPRCWWLGRVFGIKWPRGIFPSLPGGVDRVMKTYFDAWRGKGELPPELVQVVPGLRLYKNQAELETWRNWRRGISVDVGDGVTIGGAIDDLLVDDQEIHYVTDGKSRGSAPKSGQTEQYYGIQADCYAVMLRDGLKKKVSDKAFFIYYWPASMDGNMATGKVGFSFDMEVVTIAVDPDRAIKLAKEAAECLRSTSVPAASLECEQCAYVKGRTEQLMELHKAALKAAKKD